MRNVLIIEDEEDQSRALARLLRRKSLHTIVAANMAAAEEQLRKGAFQCVVLDPGLPDVENAVQAVETVDSYGFPLVVLTGTEDPDVVASARSLGASFVLKGCNGSIIKEIFSQIEYREPSRENELRILEAEASMRQGPAPSLRSFSRWVPSILSAITICGAIWAASSWIINRVENNGAERVKMEARIVEQDKTNAAVRDSIKQMTDSIRGLQDKAQTSTEDRAGIHRELSALSDAQVTAKAELTRRLERIEDNTAAVLREVTKK